MEALSGVRYVREVRELGDPDLIIIPGTKSTMDDLLWMRQNGLEASILKHAAAGKPVIGVCGGYQMLGKRIFDPFSSEAGGTEEGLDLLPVETIFRKEKFTRQKSYISSFYKGYDPLMLMVWNKLRVGSVTNHIAVKDVSQAISKDLIYNKIIVFNKTLKTDFGINCPRIAVMSLNPHNGDSGLYGKEEIEIIVPTIKKVQEDGLLVFGPYSADGFFGSASWLKFDGILCMYHDQAMTPFKVLAIDGGVNYTAGLPVIRTAPDHGTGYDIANKNLADPSSFRHAIYLALDIMNNRKEQD